MNCYLGPAAELNRDDYALIGGWLIPRGDIPTRSDLAEEES